MRPQRGSRVTGSAGPGLQQRHDCDAPRGRVSALRDRRAKALLHFRDPRRRRDSTKLEQYHEEWTNVTQQCERCRRDAPDQTSIEFLEVLGDGAKVLCSGG
jgi:hypothetical protein